MNDADLRRDELAIALGWTILRVSADSVHRRADEFADSVARRLGLR